MSHPVIPAPVRFDLDAGRFAIAPGRHRLKVENQPLGFSRVETIEARPGETICLDSLAYPGIKAIASQLGVRLQGLARDEEGSFDMDAKMATLRRAIDHHVSDEENEIFPKARQALGKTRLAEIGLRLARAKSNNGEVLGHQVGRNLFDQVESLLIHKARNDADDRLAHSFRRQPEDFEQVRSTRTYTVAPGSPGVFTSFAHGFSNGDHVQLSFSFGGVLGGGIILGTSYTIASATANTVPGQKRFRGSGSASEF